LLNTRAGVHNWRIGGYRMETREESNSLAATLENASGRLDAMAGGMSARGHKAVDTVSSVVHDAADQLRTRGERWVSSGDQVINYVREKPLMALVIAAAIGFVVNRLTR
jgi:ElaB/YqjD/DUF883 family membrane-anchored ribosome-binding protein